MKKLYLLSNIFLTLFISIMTLGITGCGLMSPTLTTECQPIGGGSISPAKGTYDNGVLVQISATPSSGYRFDHWEGSVSGSSPTVQVTMDGNKKVVAYFVKTYTLSMSANPSNSGLVSPGSGTYDEGQSVNLIAQPAQYYEFSSWAGDISDNTESVTINMNSDKNVIATFKKKTFSLELNSNVSGAGILDPVSGSYEAGSSVTIIATPENGYRFDRWSGSATGTANQIEILMDNNKNITANFVRQYLLQVDSMPMDAGSVIYTVGLQDAGSIIELTAVPNFPYYLKTWLGADSDESTNLTTVTMDTDKTVTAIFEQTVRGQPESFNGSLSSGAFRTNTTDSYSIDLKKYEWVQGEIILGTNPPISVTIQDSNGNIIRDFGNVAQANFTFMAEFDGIYTISFTNTSIFWSDYSLTYTIYNLPS